jgi:hypothetical protein
MNEITPNFQTGIHNFLEKADEELLQAISDKLGLGKKPADELRSIINEEVTLIGNKIFFCCGSKFQVDKAFSLISTKISSSKIAKRLRSNSTQMPIKQCLLKHC